MVAPISFSVSPEVPCSNIPIAMAKLKDGKLYRGTVNNFCRKGAALQWL
jgi:hypothetical protein